MHFIIKLHFLFSKVKKKLKQKIPIHLNKKCVNSNLYDLFMETISHSGVFPYLASFS